MKSVWEGETWIPSGPWRQWKRFIGQRMGHAQHESEPYTFDVKDEQAAERWENLMKCLPKCMRKDKNDRAGAAKVMLLITLKWL